jgi:hypothetical protein
VQPSPKPCTKPETITGCIPMYILVGFQTGGSGCSTPRSGSRGISKR